MRKGMLAALVVALSACFGCTELGPTLRGDDTFTAAERAAIERADTWLAERVGYAPYGIAWDLPHPARIEDAPPWSITRADAPDGAAEVFGGARVVLDPAVAGSVVGLETLAAHELGHVRGMQHHSEAGIMTGNGLRDAPQVWTAADQAECNRVRACR